jgi:hypothetical protein
MSLPSLEGLKAAGYRKLPGPRRLRTVATTEEKGRYWSKAVIPLRDVAEEIDGVAGDPTADIDELRAMLVKVRNVITQCVG